MVTEVTIRQKPGAGRVTRPVLHLIMPILMTSDNLSDNHGQIQTIADNS
jgi:hypothetical protein